MLLFVFESFELLNNSTRKMFFLKKKKYYLFFIFKNLVSKLVNSPIYGGWSRIVIFLAQYKMNQIGLISL